jgi:hypothetical protein
MGDLAFLDSMDSGFSLRTFRLGKYTSFLSYIQQKDASLQHHQKKFKIKVQLPDSLVVLGGKKLGITKQSPKHGFAGIY